MLKISLSGKDTNLMYHQKDNKDSLVIKYFSSIVLAYLTFCKKKKKKIAACGFMEIYFLKWLLCIIIISLYIAYKVLESFKSKTKHVQIWEKWDNFRNLRQVQSQNQLIADCELISYFIFIKYINFIYIYFIYLFYLFIKLN